MCDKGGECPLQNQAMSNGQGETRFHGPKRHFPKPIALSAQVLLDRERCIQCTRCTRFADEIAGRAADRPVRARPARADRDRRRGAVRLLLLRQHRAGLPGRGAHRRLVPLPGPPVRPGLHAQRVRALRRGLSAAHRPPARRGHPAAGRRRPAGQRGVELRQGPVGLHVRDAAGPADHPAGPRCRRVCCGRHPGRRRSPRPLPGWPPSAAERRCSPAGGSPSRTRTPTRSSPGWRWPATTSTCGPGRTRPRRRSSWPAASPASRPA